MHLKKFKYSTLIISVVIMLFSSLVISCSNPSDSSGGGSSGGSNENAGTGTTGGTGATGGTGGTGGTSGTGGTGNVNPFASITNPITIELSVPATTTSIDIIRRRVSETNAEISGEDWKMVAAIYFNSTDPDDGSSITKSYKEYYDVVNGYHYEYKMKVRTATDTSGTESSLGYHQATYTGLQAPDLNTTGNAYPEIHFNGQNGKKMILSNKDSVNFTFHNNETMSSWNITARYFNYAFSYNANFDSTHDNSTIEDSIWNKFVTGENKLDLFYFGIKFQYDDFTRFFYKAPASLNNEKIDGKIFKIPEADETNKTVKIRVRIQPGTRDLNIQRREKPANDTGWAQSYDCAETVGRLSEDQFTARKKDNDYLEFIDKYGLEDNKIYQYRYIYRTGNNFEWHELPLGELTNAAVATPSSRATPTSNVIGLINPVSDKIMCPVGTASINNTSSRMPFELFIAYTRDDNNTVCFCPIFKFNFPGQNQNDLTLIDIPTNLSGRTLTASVFAFIVYDDAGGSNGEGGIAQFIIKDVTTLTNTAQQFTVP